VITTQLNQNVTFGGSAGLPPTKIQKYSKISKIFSNVGQPAENLNR
jgi:hypothetical protein